MLGSKQLTLHDSKIAQISTLESCSYVSLNSNRQRSQSVLKLQWIPQPIYFLSDRQLFQAALKKPTEDDQEGEAVKRFINNGCATEISMDAAVVST